MQRWLLLWRGTRDGFTAKAFHRRCDGHTNTLTLILERDGNVFGGFTPVEWESRVPKSQYDYSNCHKGDDSLRSFLFTLRNLHGVSPRKFALKADKKDDAICCTSDEGPAFGCNDMTVSDNCNRNRHSYTCGYGDRRYESDSHFEWFYTGAQYFKVKEIEVFEIR
jgi:hypothetical protein